MISPFLIQIVGQSVILFFFQALPSAAPVQGLNIELYADLVASLAIIARNIWQDRSTHQ